MFDYDEKIDKKIEQLKDDMIVYAKKLVSFPSVSGNELGAQTYVKEVLSSLDFNHIDMWEPDIDKLKNHEAFNSGRTNFKNSPNVVGTKKGIGGGRSLILNSHIDIVPEGNLNEWNYDPFGGDIANGNIYGRGISDMKGVNASIFIVLKAFQEIGLKLKGDIIFESVIEEETGGAGSLACVLRGYKADAAIIPEPSNFAICPAQQGGVWYRITIKGKAAHGGKRYLGESAIEKIPQFIKKIRELETYINDEYYSDLYEGNPIPFCINIGKVNAGNWPSAVPDSAIIEGRIGVPPNSTLKEIRKLFEESIEKVSEEDSWLKHSKPDIEWFGVSWPSAQIEVNHPIVELTRKCYKTILNKEPLISGTPWGADAAVLTKYSGTPTLIFGPGATAHDADEHIPIDSLLIFSKILACIILDWCGFIN